MYDRTTAIGLLDGVPKQFGSQEMSQQEIAYAGQRLCALDKQQTASRFSSHQDASKSSNFCGDVAYVAALLTALGFPPSTKLTMTNKIKVCLPYRLREGAEPVTPPRFHYLRFTRALVGRTLSSYGRLAQCLRNPRRCRARGH